MPGELAKVHFGQDHKTSIPADMFHLAHAKSLKIQLIKPIFTNMLKDLDSAED